MCLQVYIPILKFTQLYITKLNQIPSYLISKSANHYHNICAILIEYINIEPRLNIKKTRFNWKLAIFIKLYRL